MSAIALIIKTVLYTLKTHQELQTNSWQEICEALPMQSKRALTSNERKLVFRVSRRVCRMLHTKNMCLVVSLTMLKLDRSDVKMYLGLYDSSTAHTWLTFEDQIYTTDQRLPANASLVYQR